MDFEESKDKQFSKYDPDKLELTLNFSLKTHQSRSSKKDCSIVIKNYEALLPEDKSEQNTNPFYARSYCVLASKDEYQFNDSKPEFFLNRTFKISMPIEQAKSEAHSFAVLIVFNYRQINDTNDEEIAGKFVHSEIYNYKKEICISGKKISFLIYNLTSKKVVKCFPLEDLLNDVNEKIKIPETKSDPVPSEAAPSEKNNNPVAEKNDKPLNITVSSTDESSLNLVEAMVKIAPNGTITLSPGVHKLSKTIHISKTFKIIGQDKIISRTTVLSDEDALIMIEGGSVKMENLSLCSNSKAPCLMIFSGTPSITNCLIDGKRLGIYASGKNSNPHFIRCDFRNSDIGLFLVEEAQGTYEKCNFTNHKDAAISITEKAKPTVEGCTIINNPLGVYVGKAGRGIFRKNVFENNTNGDWMFDDKADKIIQFQNRTDKK